MPAGSIIGSRTARGEALIYRAVTYRGWIAAENGDAILAACDAGAMTSLTDAPVACRYACRLRLLPGDAAAKSCCAVERRSPPPPAGHCMPPGYMARADLADSTGHLARRHVSPSHRLNAAPAPASADDDDDDDDCSVSGYILNCRATDNRPRPVIHTRARAVRRSLALHLI